MFSDDTFIEAIINIFMLLFVLFGWVDIEKTTRQNDKVICLPNGLFGWKSEQKQVFEEKISDNSQQKQHFLAETRFQFNRKKKYSPEPMNKSFQPKAT